MKNLILLVSIFLFLQCKPVEQDQERHTADYSTAIDSAVKAMEEVKARTNIPGLALSVMIDGEIVFSKGFGVSDLEKGTPVDPASTLFRIGSVSKSMSSLSMAVLHEQGKLDFDQPVQTYVPDFPEKRWPITVRQVAGHIAGIRHYRGDEMMSTEYFPTVGEGLAIFKEDSLLFEPGTDYSYSSYGWNLLSAVVEGASGEPFLEFMQEQVFDPLGLSNTRPDIASSEVPDRTKFYLLSNSEIVEAPYVDNSYKWAGGGFIASSEDLVKFGNSMLSPTIIKPSTVEILIESQVVNDTTLTYYGMGWSNRTREDGSRWFGHSGGSVGGITQLVIYPEKKIVVGIVSNSSNVDYDGVQHAIARWFGETLD